MNNGDQWDLDGDWGLSCAELDAMERNAVAQLASRKSSSVAPVFANLNLPEKTTNAVTSGSSSKGFGSPSKELESEYRELCSRPPKRTGRELRVRIFDDPPGRIAVESPYHTELVAVLRNLPGKRWDQLRRLWTYPEETLRDVVAEISAISKLQISLDVESPLSVNVACLAGGSQHERNDPRVEGQVFSTTPQSRQEIFVASSPNGPRSPNDLHRQPSTECSSSPKPVVKSFTLSLFLHSCGKIAVKFEYDSEMVAAFRTIPKAEWHARERLWMFPYSSLSEAEEILSSVKNRVIKVEPLVPLVKRALHATAELPDLQERYDDCVPEVLQETLMDFQVDGVKFALQHGGRALIADEMGLGKTLQALAVVSCMRDDWPVLVIVPSSLRLNWATMLQKWLGLRASDITIVMSSGSSRLGFNIVHSSGKQTVCLDGEFNIISYDVLSKLEDTIFLADFKIVIADESHYMKNPTAKRTNACIPILQRAKYALLLTGTPALSRPIELFKQLQALQPSVYQRTEEYGKRYCQGGIFGVWQGASNLNELHALVKSTVMIRRLKKDVLTQLPRKRREQVFISLDDKGSTKLRELFAQLTAAKAESRVAIGLNNADETLRTNSLERQLLAQIYTKSAEAKLPGVEDYLSTVLEAGCKFLVFGHHQSMLDGIQELLQKKKASFIRIDGKTPASVRQELVQKFQLNPQVQVALLGIHAAGVGLTFTAASTVIFAEMSWTPGDLLQAEDRVHRIGQESAVNIYYLHAHGSIDDLIWDAVQHKLENLGQVLDGEKDGTLKLGSACKNLDQVLDAEDGVMTLRPGSKRPREGKMTLDTFLKPCENSDRAGGSESSSQGQGTLDSFLLSGGGSGCGDRPQLNSDSGQDDLLMSNISKVGTFRSNSSHKRQRDSRGKRNWSQDAEEIISLDDDEVEQWGKYTISET